MKGRHIRDGTNIGRQTCYFMICSFYNCVGRRLFKYMNRCLPFQKSLEHSRTICILSHAIALSLFATLLSPHFSSFTEYLTLVNPLAFFSHVLTSRGVGIVSGEHR